MGHSVLLLLLLVQVSSLHYPLLTYYHIDIRKPWYEARKYCKEKYTDMAKFQSADDFQLLSRPQGFFNYAWIGMSDEPAHWKTAMGNSSNSWVWSATGKPSRTGYWNFKGINPDFSNAREMCVKMSSIGGWLDAVCAEPTAFVCFTKIETEVSYTFVSLLMSWSEARAYCQKKHTDLTMIEDQETNDQVFHAMRSTAIWIGLSRRPWHWGDGSPVTFNSWQWGHPSIVTGQYYVAEDSQHKWKAARVHNALPFICHKVNRLIHKVGLRFQSSADLTDAAVQTQVLRQLEEVIRAHKYTSFKMTFSSKPEIKVSVERPRTKTSSCR